MKKLVEYALYKGDEFIDIGTKDYLAKKINVSEKTITFYSSHAHLRRIKASAWIVVKLDWIGEYYE